MLKDFFASSSFHESVSPQRHRWQICNDTGDKFATGVSVTIGTISVCRYLLK
jgi:hypothetical protein